MIGVTDAWIHAALLAVSAGTTAALAGYAVRYRRIQGAELFVGLMVAFTGYSACLLAGLFTHAPGLRLLVNRIQWLSVSAAPAFWLLFAMTYTGHDDRLTRRSVAAIGAVPAATVAVVWTNPVHGLMWSHNAVVVVDGLAILEQTFGPWFWVYTAYTYGATLVGATLFVRLARLSDYLYGGQSALLVVGAVAPLLASALTVGGGSSVGGVSLDMTPYAFGISGVAFGHALFRGRLFDLVPATRRLGRDAAIRGLDDGVAIVDTDGRVIYRNAAAAELLGPEPDGDPDDTLGRRLDEQLPATPTFGGTGGTATFGRDGRSYEARASPITDRRDRLIGHTVVLADVTARRRRERALVEQRDELRTVTRLNTVIRRINRALISATTTDGVLTAVCERLAESELYDGVVAAGAATWRGGADRWITRGDVGAVDPASLPERFGDAADAATELKGDDGEGDGDGDEGLVTGGGDGQWTVVPIVYGRTLYGAIGLCAERDRISDREREVLVELGELVGHAIDAVENRQLLSAATVVEGELVSEGGGDGLAAAAAAAGGRLELDGLVPGSGAGRDPVAYVRVDGAVGDARAALADGDGRARTVGGDGAGDGTPDRGKQLVEWTVPKRTILGGLDASGARVTAATAADGTARYTVEVASEAGLRRLLDRVGGPADSDGGGLRLAAKRELDRPIDPGREEPGGAAVGSADGEDLTDRQREALEAAYRAGYFDWPRESTAEEVADALDITAPTLHGHLRKAERTVVGRLFGTDGGGDGGPSGTEGAEETAD